MRTPPNDDRRKRLADNAVRLLQARARKLDAANDVTRRVALSHLDQLLDERLELQGATP